MAKKLRVEEVAGGEIAKEIHTELDSSTRAKTPCSVHVVPQLRVEAVVAVLVNDPNASSFSEMAHIENINGLNQVPNLPNNLGTPVVYAGSTTGPGYNEKASPFQVTWSVRPEVVKLDINTVAAWLADNPFDENHAHGVRNLVVNPDLLSVIR